MKFQKIRKRKTNIVYEHIYVEPRKTGQLSLFAGQEQRHRCREMRSQWGRRGGVNWETGMDMYTLPGVNQVACGKLLIAQRTQLAAA